MITSGQTRSDQCVAGDAGAHGWELQCGGATVLHGRTWHGGTGVCTSHRAEAAQVGEDRDQCAGAAGGRGVDAPRRFAGAFQRSREGEGASGHPARGHFRRWRAGQGGDRVESRHERGALGAGNKDKESEDPKGYGTIEYAYHLMAKAAGSR